MIYDVKTSDWLLSIQADKAILSSFIKKNRQKFQEPDVQSWSKTCARRLGLVPTDRLFYQVVTWGWILTDKMIARNWNDSEMTWNKIKEKRNRKNTTSNKDIFALAGMWHTGVITTLKISFCCWLKLAVLNSSIWIWERSERGEIRAGTFT